MKSMEDSGWIRESSRASCKFEKELRIDPVQEGDGAGASFQRQTVHAGRTGIE
jgi:hypothetical protein